MIDRATLERLYCTYNRREYVHPDPLEFLYKYDDPLDSEIVGLVASSLAYGRVAQILRSVATVLDRIPEPAKYVRIASKGKLERIFGDFKHRFTTGEEIASMLYGAGSVMRRYGSLQACFAKGLSDNDETILPALCFFVDEISSSAGGSLGHLLPHPSNGSACKRENLFLRWMIRRDDVDPGGWYTLSARRLIVPLDVHMFRISRALGLTQRRQADLRCAVEITESFRGFTPEDPVKYDFALTRFGIRDELDSRAFLDSCVGEGNRPVD